MADALVSIALEKVTKILEKQLTLHSGVLHDAESRQVTDESVRDWLSKLKDIAYDVDDVLDARVTSGLGTDRNDGRYTGKKVCTCLLSSCSCFSQAWSRYKIANCVKEIRERLDQIADEKNKYKFRSSNSLTRGRRVEKSESRTSSLVDEFQIFGREEEKDTIVSKLVRGSSSYEEPRVQVISIVGVGGLGKTALAGLISKDDRVQSHFEKVLWVCVSDDFDVVRLTKAIIENAKGDSTSLSELDTLQNELLATIRGKLFLLILDDVWNDDSEEWDKVRLSLQSGAHGSKILVTTRSEKVATAMNSVDIHKLEYLSDDACWSVFSARAFARRKTVPAELEMMGREIVQKCKGVPLSAKVIGSAMQSKRTSQDWQDILESETWALPDVAKGILPALLLSYYNLPVHLKQCFAYCSLFPKDTVLEKDRLIKLWLAQGFIQSQGKRDREEIGGEYFDDLTARSMFQDVEGVGRETKCKMHDLLHDLAVFITKDESCICESGKLDSISIMVRHLSLIVSDPVSHIPSSFRNTKKLRTLLVIGHQGLDRIPFNVFHHARFLRTLDIGRHTKIGKLPNSIGKLLKHLRYLNLSLTNIKMLPHSIGELEHLGFLNLSYNNISKLPNSIGKLKHLRYLNLSGSKIVELPESVSHLHNLQALELNYCDHLRRLPMGMREMVSLRHLGIEDTNSLEYLPRGLGEITSLQTLSKFVVGGSGGCRIGELKQLNSLQGNLPIKHLERVSSREESEEAELWNKLELRCLTLEMSGDGEIERMESVLEGLRPPHMNLEELTISGYNGAKFPSWMEDLPFSNLAVVILSRCRNCAELPGLGKLPSLRSLTIKDTSVRKVGREFYGNSYNGGSIGVTFPKLKELKFQDMHSLEEWEMTMEDGETMPSLQRLALVHCTKLRAWPQHLPNTLTYLEIEGCDQISRMPHSLPLLEKFILWSSNGVLSGSLPDLPKLKKFSIFSMEIAKLPDGWEQLLSLEHLSIVGNPNMESLPDGFGQLKALKILEIAYCPALRSLPQGLHDLTHLANVDIHGCPLLSERCKWEGGGGEDWPKIAHVLDISLDDSQIEQAIQ